MGSKFSVEEITQILEMMKSNDVTEFRLELDEGKLWLKRGAEQHPVPQISYGPPPGNISPAFASYPTPAAPVSLTSAPPSPLAPVKPPEPAKKYHELKSPMVGTFYRRPSPDAAPYVQVGDTVRKGQVVCIVEAMKLMNEIQSDTAGKIVELCLDEGQMAEYGEVLFRIEN